MSDFIHFEQPKISFLKTPSQYRPDSIFQKKTTVQTIVLMFFAKIKLKRGII